MKSHTYTVVLFSDRSGIRSYSITLNNLVKRTLLLIFTFGIISAGITYSSYDVRKKIDMLQSLEKEKQEIIEKLEALKPGSEFENYKSVMNNPTLNAVDMKRRGIGGDEYNLELGALDSESSRKTLSGSTADLNGDTYFQIISGVFMKYVDLQHQVALMQHRLDHLPSVFPVNAPILSGYGNRISPFTGLKSFHRGVDLACELETPIAAPAAGTVVDVSTNPIWGLNITIDHGSGIKTQYGHLNKTLVRKGERVNRWDVIAESGQSGRTTGPHLHYQIWLEGEPVNPVLFVMNDERENQR